MPPINLMIFIFRIMMYMTFARYPNVIHENLITLTRRIIISNTIIETNRKQLQQ